MEIETKENRWLQAICDKTKRRLKPLYWTQGYYLLISNRKHSSFIVDQIPIGESRYQSKSMLYTLRGRVEGAKIDARNGKLIIPASDRSALILHYACKSGEVVFTEEAKSLYTTMLLRWQLYYAAAEKQAKFKLENELDQEILNIPEREGVEAGLYQRAAVACALTVPGYGFFMEQGAGKTYPAIMAMEERAREFNKQQGELQEKDPRHTVKPYQVLIVAPKSVTPNWENELDGFAHGKGKVISLHGNKVARTKKVMDAIITPSVAKDPVYGYDWVAVIMSYGLLDNDISMLLYVKWNLCILDESHYIKNARAKRTLAAFKLRNQCDARLCMTGTPMPNGARDLFAQFEFMGEGFSGYPTQNAFTSAYAHLVEYRNNGKEGAPVSKFTGMRNVDELQEKMSTIAFTMTKKEALPNLPPKTYDLVGIEMTTEQKQYYKEVLNKVVIEYETDIQEAEGDAKNTAMVLQNVLKRMLRLSQITSGFFVTDDICNDEGEVIVPGETHRFDPNPKIDKLIEILKAKDRTNKTIIWSNWLQDVRTINARLRIENIGNVVLTGATPLKKRKEVVDAFNNDPNILVYLGNPAAGGIGVNLLGHSDEDTNCNQVIVVSQDWNAAIRQQSEDRPYRKGTRVHVQITDLVVPGTVDQRIRDVVTGKRTLSNQVQNVSSIMHQLIEDLSDID